MVAVAERRRHSGVARGARERRSASASDWRERLLADLCAGREGARLRQLMRGQSRNRIDRRRHEDVRSERRLPVRLEGHRARAIRALLAMNALREDAPDRVARYEARIRFALDRVDETRALAHRPVRADRLAVALEVLDRYVSDAEDLVVMLDLDVAAAVA